jgi:GxxExxY protein
MDVNEISHKIIGCAMLVHNTLGNGFQEVIYQRALAIEMNLANLEFKREMGMPIFYRNMQIGTRRVDFFVENCVMVELKTIEKILDTNKSQANNDLEAFHIAEGLLINFGGSSLEFECLYNRKMVNSENNISIQLEN